MKKIILFFIKMMCKIFKPRLKYIIFESYPECDGSPKMVYDLLKKKGYDSKYKLIWAIDKSFKSCKEPHFIRFGKLTIQEKARCIRILVQTKLIIDSNRPIKKINPRTIRFFTRHGGPLKRVPRYTRALGEMDYVLATSDLTKSLDFIDYQGFCCKNINQILPLGFPANDRLFEKSNLISTGFYQKHLSNDIHFDKVIGWLPTIRQGRIGKRVDSEKIFPFGMPLIYSIDDLYQLNTFLNKKNILLAIQLHHAQLDNFTKKTLSNIIFISQEIKYEMNVSLINMLTSFDALITDYSSVYYEFLLLNRPIALSIDDFDSYTQNTALYIDYFDWIKGVYLKKFSDLTQFIDMVANGIDIAKEDRDKSLHKVYKHLDNQSTQRVVDFIIEKARL